MVAFKLTPVWFDRDLTWNAPMVADYHHYLMLPVDECGGGRYGLVPVLTSLTVWPRKGWLT